MSAVYITARGRRFHAVPECRALLSAQALSDWDYDYEFPPPAGARLPEVHAVVPIRQPLAAVLTGYTACRVCTPPAEALPATGETYGHEPVDEYAGTPEGARGVSRIVCARCVSWWRLALGGVRIGRRTSWPCASALVLGLVPREVSS